MRKPSDIKAAGGFKAKGYDNPDGTLYQHVVGLLPYPSRNPFISTTSSMAVGREKASTDGGYLYILDDTLITEKIHDVNAELAADGLEAPGHAWEMEFAVEHFIPWEAVVQSQRYVDGQWKVVKAPTKRETAGYTGAPFTA